MIYFGYGSSVYHHHQTSHRFFLCVPECASLRCLCSALPLVKVRRHKEHRSAFAPPAEPSTPSLVLLLPLVFALRGFFFAFSFGSVFFSELARPGSSASSSPEASNAEALVCSSVGEPFSSGSSSSSSVSASSASKPKIGRLGCGAVSAVSSSESNSDPDSISPSTNSSMRRTCAPNSCVRDWLSSDALTNFLPTLFFLSILRGLFRAARSNTEVVTERSSSSSELESF
mmetsp:Transcript_5658/g.24006  ORF Transcript_5658/g.24006 Transcript_5658/m.24006 type:complete len:229 (+) Transcript_5658:2538-3224(+)